MPSAGRHYDGCHQREDDRVLAGQLEQDEYRRDRGSGRAAERGAHADQSVGPGGFGDGGNAECATVPNAVPAMAANEAARAETMLIQMSATNV